MELAKISTLTILALALLFNVVSGKTRKLSKSRKNRLKDRKMWKYIKQLSNKTEFSDQSTPNYLETNIYQSLEFTTINTSQDVINNTPQDVINSTPQDVINNTSQNIINNISQDIAYNYEDQYNNTTIPQYQLSTNIVPSTDSTVLFLTSTNASETINTESNLTNAYEDFLQFNDELDNITNNLQQVSKDWYFNVRFHCSNNWRSIQEVLEENQKALIDWEIALFDIINKIQADNEVYDEIENEPTESFEEVLITPDETMNKMTVPPELLAKYLRIHAAKNKKMKTLQSKTTKQEFNEKNDKEPKIKSKCISAINLAEALRVYWKEEILGCLQTYFKEIKHEEASARNFEEKINSITLDSSNVLANITGEYDQLQGKNKSERAESAWHKVKSKLKGLRQELERRYLNHEVQNLQISMGIEMCRQVGKIYHKTMDQQLQAIHRISQLELVYSI